MEKNLLRKEILRTRRDLGEVVVREKSINIISRLRNSQRFLTARRIALYHPFRNEVDLLPLLADTAVEWLFPRVVSDTKVLAFHRIVTAHELFPGYRGIYEPSADAPRVAIADIALFLVPGVAFSRTGERIGYGGGYYDASLKEKAAGTTALGVGFDLQVITDGFSDPWDTRLDGIVTESGLFEISPSH